ncbi:DoxX family protein [Pararoseomonas indoligenes]|uniref:DoxX family protein n=1 Tax=Roseomonas indoligenes TaxID=2820811 RepID=A0A940S796_9PROT|nr:DoxX family protein [Pararoseomonas indoligenes]MBP0496391.1 DoxX family protein [Pararoseomonas indoligenes]
MDPAARNALTTLGLLGLCAAYIQGGVNKLLDYPGAVAEAAHFGLPLPPAVAAATIVLELGASVMILAGWYRWLGALGLMAFTLAATLIANRYWELPGGMERFMMANSFYEHLGLAGALLLVALWDRRSA